MKKAIWKGMLRVFVAVMFLMLVSGLNGRGIQGTIDQDKNPEHSFDSCNRYIEKLMRFSEPMKLLGNTGENTQITDNLQDDARPSLILDSEGNLFLVCIHKTNEKDWDICFRISKDGGKTWPEENVWCLDLPGIQASPDVCLSANGHIYGAFIDRTEDCFCFFDIPNSTNPESWKIYSPFPTEWYNENRFEFDEWNHKKTCITANLLGGNNTICIGFISDIKLIVGKDYSVEEGVVLCTNVPNPYAYSGKINWTYSFDSKNPGCDNPSLASSSKYIYYAFQRYNYTSNREEINVRWANPWSEEDIEFWEHRFTIKGKYEVKNPSIATAGENVYIAYQSNAGGCDDIACKYSLDDGKSWQDKKITNTPSISEQFPTISARGEKVWCIYMYNSNLYLVQSFNCGKTWEGPFQVNVPEGSVVEEYRYADIMFSNITWTDSRNIYKDIYFETATAEAIIEGMNGGNKVTVTIKNIGMLNAQNLSWAINLEGLVFIGQHYEGNIQELKAGDETNIETGFIFGFGPATIKVAVGDKTKIANCFLVGPLVLGIE